MEGTALEYFPYSVYPLINETKSEFCSYINGDNEQNACYSHAPMIKLFQISLS